MRLNSPSVYAHFERIFTSVSLQFILFQLKLLNPEYLEFINFTR